MEQGAVGNRWQAAESELRELIWSPEVAVRWDGFGIAEDRSWDGSRCPQKGLISH